MMSQDPPKKDKRVVQKLTNGDRKWICQRKLNPAFKEEKFAEMQEAFKRERNPAIELKSGTVSGILKQSDKWLSIGDGQEDGTRTRSSKEPELEAALYAWRAEQLAKDEKVRDEDLRYKAREIAAAMGINTDKGKGLSFSSGWLDRFKKRNSIKQTRYNRHGKKSDAEKMSDVHTGDPFQPMTGTPMHPDAMAASVPHNANTAVGLHSPMSYLPPHLQQTPVHISGGIPPVAHVASVAQPVSVPLPQEPFPHDAAIPQPPSGPGEEANLMSNGGQYAPSTLYTQLVPQPPGPTPPGDGDAGSAGLPPGPGASPVQQGMAIGAQAIAQGGYVDAHGQMSAVPVPQADAHRYVPQPPAMGIPEPDYQAQAPGDVPESAGMIMAHDNSAMCVSSLAVTCDAVLPLLLTFLMMLVQEGP